jgi:hypothetical protein
MKKPTPVFGFVEGVFFPHKRQYDIFTISFLFCEINEYKLPLQGAWGFFFP